MPTILKKTFPCQAFCFGPLKIIGDYTPSFFQQASKLYVGFFRKRKKVYKPKFCSFNVSSACNLEEAFTNIANFPITKIRCVLQKRSNWAMAWYHSFRWQFFPFEFASPFWKVHETWRRPRLSHDARKPIRHVQKQ